MKRFVASCFMRISSVDSKKRNGTHAGLIPSEQQALFLLPMEGSDYSLAQSAPVMQHVSGSDSSKMVALRRNDPPPKCEMLPVTCLGRCDGIVLQQVR